jgi:ribosomal protein S12 methylthiotransferase accessory factor
MQTIEHYPFRRLQDLLPHLVDARHGIIKYVAEYPIDAGAPQLFRYIARAADTRGFGFPQNFGNSGGAAITRNAAIAKAIGEALERYAAAIYSKSELPLCSYRDAPFPCVAPERLVSYSSEQYAQPGFLFRPLREDSAVRWVRAEDLVTGQAVHVPAGLVYLPYRYAKDGPEQPFAQPISTGLACHCSREEAIIGGLCEVIERDAFTITWQAEVSRARLIESTLSAANQQLAGRYRKAGYDVALVDVTSDVGVPTIMAVLRGRSDTALPLAVATSADLDPEDAVRKALEELAHTERHSVGILRNLPRVPEVPGFTNVDTQTAHLNFWCSWERRQETAFLTASPREVSFSELPNLASGNATRDLAALAERIAATGHQALYVDVTSSDLRSLGLWVVRALIPGFQPLVMGHLLRPLGGQRLWALPGRLGFEGRTRTQGDYPFPHPFP